MNTHASLIPPDFFLLGDHATPLSLRVPLNFSVSFPTQMAARGLLRKWCDVLFLGMLVSTGGVILINRTITYDGSTQPLQAWIMVNCSTLFGSWLLINLDNAIAAMMSWDRGLNTRQRLTCFCGRVAILLILSLLLYPFLCVWTVIGTVRFTSARSLPEGQKLGFILWLFFGYFILLSIAWKYIGKVMVDMIRIPGWWAFEGTALVMRRISHETSAHQRFYLTTTQALIQKLPKFKLEVVPTDCNECAICLEGFSVDNEIRGLPCAHNFHVKCIDKWLQLNLRCPQCRGLVIPNRDHGALSDHQASIWLQTASGLTSNLYEHPLPTSTRLHGLTNSVLMENPVADSDTEIVVESTENAGLRTDQVPPCSSV